MNFKLRPIILFLLVPLLFAGCAENKDKGFNVVASTSTLGAILEEVGGNKIQVTTILPGEMCPGHFDLKPEDKKAAEKARLLFYQGWESWFTSLLNHNKNEETRKPVSVGQGNLMLPEKHKKAVLEITEALKESDPANESYYSQNARRYKERIIAFEEYMKTFTDSFKEMKAVCSVHQEEFLRLLGFEIVATYKRSNNMSAADWKDAIKLASENNASLVADNLQSGPRDGKIISQELNIPRVVLSNFTLDKSYSQTVKDNLNRIIEAVLPEVDD
ncbi:MAG: metal ABC transporter substrate-binding protein [Elusimicrobiota bacterium]